MLAIGEKELEMAENESWTGGFDAAGGGGRYLHPIYGSRAPVYCCSDMTLLGTCFDPSVQENKLRHSVE